MKKKTPSYAQEIADIATGGQCRHNDQYTRITYKPKTVEHRARECWLITVPEVRFYAHTHTCVEDAEKLFMKISKTYIGRVGRRRIKAQPQLTKIEKVSHDMG